jgi:hypothetical protein
MYDDTVLIMNTVFERCLLLTVSVEVYCDIDRVRNLVPGGVRLLLLVVLEHTKKGN